MHDQAARGRFRIAVLAFMGVVFVIGGGLLATRSTDAADQSSTATLPSDTSIPGVVPSTSSPQTVAPPGTTPATDTTDTTVTSGASNGTPSADESAKALDVTKADPVLGPLFGDGTATASEYHEWLSPDGKHLGVAVVVDLRTPIVLKAGVPGFTYAAKPSAGNEEPTIVYGANGMPVPQARPGEVPDVGRLIAYVDLSGGVVLIIEPAQTKDDLAKIGSK